jgi:AraC-like DNA-binding protein
MELFLPALVYLYILSLTQDDFVFKRKHLLHFIPGVFYAVHDIIFYLVALGHELMAAKSALVNQSYYNQINIIEDYLIVVLTISYVLLGYKKIKAYLAWLTQFKQYKTFPIYTWLKSLIFWSSILGVVLMVNQLLDAFSLFMSQPMYRWRFFNLVLAFITYYLGFMGYKNDNLKVHLSKANLTSLAKKMSQSQIETTERRLLDKLNNQSVYLDGDLTLKQLASQLEVTTENLSLVVNQKFEMGFRDLINSYRVNHIKTLLNEARDPQKSILDLALDSGFNSQASFYRAFKKQEGMSPKAFMEKQA